MVNIQIVSDLHLESPKAYDLCKIEARAPILALLGDIGYAAAHKDEYIAFLKEHLNRFQAVLLVPGNHEAYKSDWSRTLAVLQSFEEDTDRRRQADSTLGEFRLLDRCIYRPSGSDILILGCSLFSYVPASSHDHVSFGLQDFYDIGDGWDVDAHNAAHARDVAWLNKQVTTPNEDNEAGPAVKKIVILTHWSPTTDQRASDPLHKASPISSGFVTDMSGEACWRDPRVKLWAWGHTHYNCDFEVERDDAAGNIRGLANQQGYYHRKSDAFEIAKVVEV